MSAREIDETLVVAPDGLEAETVAELGEGAARVVDAGRLFRVPRARHSMRTLFWNDDVWLTPVRIAFAHDDDAVRALKSLGARWSMVDLGHARRATAIARRLAMVANEPIAFPSAASTDPRGAFAVVAPNEIIASARCTSVFADGAPTFVEDRHGPPSRAYLKLWEAWHRLGRWPRYGDRCVDLGSSPGGWTWAMQRLDAWVLSVDKAPLDPRIARLPRVECRRASAFALDPKSVGTLDWIVSDVIAYPDRLLAMIDRWIDVHPSASFVVTLKFQGKTDMTPVLPFFERRGGVIVHLHHNKHELTWLRAGAGLAKRRRRRRRVE
jgi:23S rRNA (cytidine2498-2'-O)-methyltransferase